MKIQQSRIDYTLLFLVFLLMCISLLAVYSGSNEFIEGNAIVLLKKQVIFYVVGMLVLMAVMAIDFDYFKYLSIPAYIFGLLLLVLVQIFGTGAKGAKRWLWGTQPSEFMKVILLLALAYLLYKIVTKNRERSLKEDFILIVKVMALTFPPFFLIYKQPDLGTSLVILSLAATMIFIAGVRWRIVLSVAGVGIAMFIGFIYLYYTHPNVFVDIVPLETHQMERIHGWLDPMSNLKGEAFQFYQGILGIGSGQLTGSGFLNGVQTKKIPEVYNDFVFAVIGEEFGFLGAIVLLLVYFLLFYRMITIALNCNNLYGTYLVAGAVGLLVFQVFENIAMTVGLMPITGLALPFISYGGSALLTNMVLIGIVMNVRYRTQEYMFKSEEGDG